MEQKRYSPKLGIDVESIARMAASKNIKGALSIHAPKFSTPQDIYRFGWDYNKFELAPKSQEETATRPVLVQFKKGKKASGINKQSQDALNNTYSSDNELFNNMNQTHEWVRDTTRLPSWLGGMVISTHATSQFLPRMKEETMQKNTIKQRIANNCYNIITARLLREQQGGNQAPTKSWWDDLITGVGDIGRWAAPPRAAMDFIYRSRDIPSQNPWVRAVKLALKGIQASGIVADTATVIKASTVSNPAHPQFTTTTTSDAWVNLGSAIAGVAGGAPKAIEIAGAIQPTVKKVVRVGRVSKPGVRDQLNADLPFIPKLWTPLSQTKKHNALTAGKTAVQVSNLALATYLTRPGVIDSGRTDPIVNPENQFQFVQDFLTRLGRPLPRANAGSGSVPNRNAAQNWVESDAEFEAENLSKKPEDRKAQDTAPEYQEAPPTNNKPKPGSSGKN